MPKIRHQQPTGQNHQNQISLRLRAPFGSSYLVEPDDIIDTKRALMALDYYQPVAGTEPGAFVDNDLFAGIKAFQRDHGLKVDGLRRPGGETETTLNAALRHADPSRPIPDGEGANDNQPPANENESGWDDARRPGGGWGAVEEERAGAKATDVKNAESRCVINTESRTNDIATMCSASAARKTAIGVAQSCGGDIKAVYGICLGSRCHDFLISQRSRIEHEGIFRLRMDKKCERPNSAVHSLCIRGPAHRAWQIRMQG